MVTEVTRYLSRDGRDHKTEDAANNWELACDLRDALLSLMRNCDARHDYERHGGDDYRENAWSVAFHIAMKNQGKARKMLAAIK